MKTEQVMVIWYWIGRGYMTNDGTFSENWEDARPFKSIRSALISGGNLSNDPSRFSFRKVLVTTTTELTDP